MGPVFILESCENNVRCQFYVCELVIPVASTSLGCFETEWNNAHQFQFSSIRSVSVRLLTHESQPARLDRLFLSRHSKNVGSFKSINTKNAHSPVGLNLSYLPNSSNLICSIDVETGPERVGASSGSPIE